MQRTTAPCKPTPFEGFRPYRDAPPIILVATLYVALAGCSIPLPGALPGGGGNPATELASCTLTSSDFAALPDQSVIGEMIVGGCMDGVVQVLPPAEPVQVFTGSGIFGATPEQSCSNGELDVFVRDTTDVFDDLSVYSAAVGHAFDLSTGEQLGRWEAERKNRGMEYGGPVACSSHLAVITLAGCEEAEFLTPNTLPDDGSGGGAGFNVSEDQGAAFVDWSAQGADEAWLWLLDGFDGVAYGPFEGDVSGGRISIEVDLPAAQLDRLQRGVMACADGEPLWSGTL